MPIGPALPPHLESKRKRDNNDEATYASPDAAEKRRKTLGPSLPPGPLDERPISGRDANRDPASINDSDSDSDDDYGPSLPRGPADPNPAPLSQAPPAVEEEDSKPSGRDSWMLNPPQQDDLAARMDPTKLRARKFNTSRAGRPPAGGGSSEIDVIWTETPEQKAQRLKNSVMGVTAKTSTPQAQKEGRSKEDIETARRLEKARGKSLLDAHQERKDKEEEDDPSKRTFDYEKDVGGVRVGRLQKKEMLGRAKEFGSRFSGGSYL